jgi:adenylylsulfate reductase, subunit B
MPPLIDPGACNGCGLCAESCPTDVFTRDKAGEIPEVRYPEECWHCNSCVLDCPQSAVRLRIPLPAMVLHIPGAEATEGALEPKE